MIEQQQEVRKECLPLGSRATVFVFSETAQGNRKCTTVVPACTRLLTDKQWCRWWAPLRRMVRSFRTHSQASGTLPWKPKWLTAPRRPSGGSTPSPKSPAGATLFWFICTLLFNVNICSSFFLEGMLHTQSLSIIYLGTSVSNVVNKFNGFLTPHCSIVSVAVPAGTLLGCLSCYPKTRKKRNTRIHIHPLEVHAYTSVPMLYYPVVCQFL